VVLVIQNSLILLSGFVLLVLSGDKLVETSIRIARRWNIPTSVIAVTIIAAGTSAPELVTSFLAGFKGNSDISVGNVIGSNTFNLLAVGGLSLILQPLGAVRGSLPSWVVLVLGTGLFYYCLSDTLLSRPEAIVFLVALNGFVIFSFFREREKEETFENLEGKSLPRTLVFFCLSFAGLVLGAELALIGGVELGKLAGLSERVIAITIISVGTGLPELATSMAAAFRGHSEIALANVIGSNIFNTLAIPGATAAFFALKVDEQFISHDFYVMTAATLSVCVLFLVKNPVVRRGFGVLMFLAYSAYATSLLLQ
jgi:cation:H+ antiporter